MLIQSSNNQNNEDNYDGLLVSIEANQGKLNLLLAVCDTSDFRDKIIQQYEEELDASFPKYRVKLSHENPSLTSNLRELVARNPELKSQQNAVITVTGTEQFRFLPQQKEATKTPLEELLGYLQWTREALREFPYSIVLWINSYLEVKISQKAPDFWSWRKGVFRFVSPATSIVNLGNIKENIEFFTSELNQETSSLLPLEDLQELIQKIETNQGKTPQLANLYSNLGQLYRERTEQGKSINYAEEQALAIEYLQKAIELQKEFNLEIDLASSLDNLAALYYSQGKYEQAESLEFKVLEMRRKVLGEEHLDVAQSLNNLAAVYRRQEKYEQAESLHLQALEIRKKILGENHPDIANSLNNLAYVYYGQGQYQKAENLYIQALELYKKLLGEEHPAVATFLYNLAELYQNQRKYEQAESLFVQALKMNIKLLGEGHPNVALSMSALAVLYESQMKYEQAESLFVQAIIILSKTIGDNNPYSLKVYNDFNNFLQQVITEGKESILSNDPLTQSLLKELKSILRS